MSTNLDLSLPNVSPVVPTDLLAGMSGSSEQARIKKVSQAMESLFASQLMAELGKGVGGMTESKEGNLYSDFIQQAMTQQVTSGGGFGLAKTIESYLTQHVGHKPEASGQGTSHHAHHLK